MMRPPPRSTPFPSPPLLGAGGDARRSIVFADRAEVHATEHRHVVGAVDGDRDLLAGGAVGGDRGEAVGDRLAGAQLLDQRLSAHVSAALTSVGRKPACALSSTYRADC